MQKTIPVASAVALVMGLAAGTSNVQAGDDFWDMMNPAWWMGLDDDDDDDWKYWVYGPGRYYRHGYGGPWGGYGYGYPGYGYRGYPQAQSNKAPAPTPPPVPE
jgi:hypothetical protein